MLSNNINDRDGSVPESPRALPGNPETPVYVDMWLMLRPPYLCTGLLWNVDIPCPCMEILTAATDPPSSALPRGDAECDPLPALPSTPSCDVLERRAPAHNHALCIAPSATVAGGGAMAGPDAQR